MSARRLSGALLAAAVFTVAAAGAAQARELTYVVGHKTELGTGRYGIARAPCPDRAGVHVWGGGQYVGMEFTDTTVPTSAPVDFDDNGLPDDGWKARIDQPAGSNQKARAVAVCARSATTYVTRYISIGSGLEAETRRVPCRPGTKVVGGGIFVDAPAIEFSWVESSAPYDGRDEDSRPDDGWRVTAGAREQTRQAVITAVCAEAKLRYVLARRSATSDEPVARANCPGAARVVGGGATSAASDRILSLATSAPFAAAGDGPTPDDGWEAVFDTFSRGGGRITAYAICLQ